MSTRRVVVPRAGRWSECACCRAVRVSRHARCPGREGGKGAVGEVEMRWRAATVPTEMERDVSATFSE